MWWWPPLDGERVLFFFPGDVRPSTISRPCSMPGGRSRCRQGLDRIGKADVVVAGRETGRCSCCAPVSSVHADSHEHLHPDDDATPTRPGRRQPRRIHRPRRTRRTVAHPTRSRRHTKPVPSRCPAVSCSIASNTADGDLSFMLLPIAFLAGGEREAKTCTALVSGALPGRRPPYWSQDWRCTKAAGSRGEAPALEPSSEVVVAGAPRDAALAVPTLRDPTAEPSNDGAQRRSHAGGRRSAVGEGVSR